MQPGQESRELGLNQSAEGCIQCATTGGQWLAHSLRTWRLGPVPPCVQPLPVMLNAGNEAKWTPVEVGRSDSKKWGEYGGKQEVCQEKGCRNAYYIMIFWLLWAIILLGGLKKSVRQIWEKNIRGQKMISDNKYHHIATRGTVGKGKRAESNMGKSVTAHWDTSFIEVKVYAQNPTSRPRTLIIQYTEKITPHLLIICQIKSS